MLNIEAIDQATSELNALGVRVLNAYLLGDTEQEHVAVLLDLMLPPPNAVVLDAGCGVGEVAKIMAEARLDLSFKLVNLSAAQLAQCPEGMERIEADFAAIPLPDASVDVVMFNFSLCHATDWGVALREAARLLKDGGIVFIFDMGRESGDNTLMTKLLQAGAYRPAAVIDIAARCDLELHQALGHKPAVLRLREAFADKTAYDAAFAGVFPMTLRFTRRAREVDPLESAFRRHERIGFQFSGGRDSTTALYLLRAYWSRMTVYHVNVGDQFPELRQVVDKVFADLRAAGCQPQTIQGNVDQVRRQYGLPSDVVPVDNTEIGRLVSGRAVKIISRYECCARALMNPMHQRMQQDGITLIVRGQRDDEYAQPPMRSGNIEGGIEVLYPIQEWDEHRVTSYLADNGLPIAPFYERGMKRAPECMRCTAWWDEGRAAYLREFHPSSYDDYTQRIGVVRRAINRQMAQLED